MEEDFESVEALQPSLAIAPVERSDTSPAVVIELALSDVGFRSTNGQAVIGDLDDDGRGRRLTVSIRGLQGDGVLAWRKVVDRNGASRADRALDVRRPLQRCSV